MKINNLSLLTWACALLFVFGLAGCDSSSNETAEDDVTTEETLSEEDENESLPSPRRKVSGDIDGVMVTLDYGSPAVRGRVIFGDLEPWGEVWRAGANATTSVEFSESVTINGVAFAPGKYGIFMIPNESGDWVVIFNAEWDGWGAYSYDAAKDIVRVNVTPQMVDEVSERLSYRVEGGAIHFAWDKVRLSIPVSRN
jgi:hypothetical protein